MPRKDRCGATTGKVLKFPAPDSGRLSLRSVQQIFKPSNRHWSSSLVTANFAVKCFPIPVCVVRMCFTCHQIWPLSGWLGLAPLWDISLRSSRPMGGNLAPLLFLFLAPDGSSSTLLHDMLHHDSSGLCGSVPVRAALVWLSFLILFLLPAPANIGAVGIHRRTSTTSNVCF